MATKRTALDTADLARLDGKNMRARLQNERAYNRNDRDARIGYPTAPFAALGIPQTPQVARQVKALRAKGKA